MMRRVVGFVSVSGVLWLCSPTLVPVAVQAPSGPGKVIAVAPRASVQGVFTMAANPVFDVGGVRDNPNDEFDHINGRVRCGG